MKCYIQLLATLGLWMVGSAFSLGATTLDTQDYFLYFGDFNGDGKTDVLYIAKNPSNASGIDVSDGTGPNIPWQSWPSNYLNIPWSSGLYNIIIADFNGDGKADIFLQSITPGDSYLLITDSNGKITSIKQTLAYGALGASYGWSADQHHLVAGDFNHDGHADLFLQAVSHSGTNAVVFANADGTLTAVAQSWSDGYLGFKWAANEANIFSGDFNGDGYADLLIQAKPLFVEINFDPPFPIPTYAPNLNGIVKAAAGATPFVLAGVQAWSRMSNGVDWSPLSSTITVGDFNGDGRSDIVLQGRYSGRPSMELSGNASGSDLTAGTSLASNVSWTSDITHLSAANFSGTGAAGLFLQATSQSGTSYVVTGITNTSATVTMDNPLAANEMVAYTYDALGRLTSTSHSGAVNSGVQTSYSYDLAGNRTNVTVTGSPNSTQPP